MKLLAAMVVAFACGCSSEALPWVAQEHAERRADAAEAATRVVVAELAAVKEEFADRCPALRQGESIWDFARKLNVNANDVLVANGMNAAALSSLRTGTRLCVPRANPSALAYEAGGRADNE